MTIMHILTIMVMLVFIYIATVSIILLNMISDSIKPEATTYVIIIQPETDKVEEVVKSQPKTEVKSIVETEPKVVVNEPQQEVKAVTNEPKPEVKTAVNEPKKEVKALINEPPEHKHPHEKETKMDDDTYLLAQIINAEAKGEPYNGKVAVGNVVLNRVNSPDFPDTIKEVIFERGQFYPVTSGSIYNKPSEESIKAAKDVMNGKQIVSKQALYFYNPDTSTSDWIFSRKTIMDIGNHRFAY